MKRNYEQYAGPLILALACVVHYVVTTALTNNIILDVDPVNLAIGMLDFNVHHYAPHPPGYLVYVWVLRALHWVVGGTEIEVVHMLARLFSTATIPLIYIAVRMLRPTDPFSPAVGALLTAFHPFFVFHAVDGQTHTSEGFAAALLLVAILHYRRQPNVVRAILMGLVLALGSSFRPSFVVAGVGPIIWATGFARFRHLVLAGTASVIGALAWLLPTFHLSGGYTPWKRAHDALVNDIFVRKYSLFSEFLTFESLLEDVYKIGYWAAIAIAPAIVAGVAWLGSQQRIDLPTRKTSWLVVVSAVPSIFFYLSMFCSEPGYFLGFVPFVIVVSALLGAPLLSPTRRKLAYTGAFAAQLLVLAAPPLGPFTPKMPSISEIGSRQVILGLMVDQLRQRFPLDVKFLFVSDKPDIVFSR